MSRILKQRILYQDREPLCFDGGVIFVIIFIAMILSQKIFTLVWSLMKRKRCKPLLI